MIKMGIYKLQQLKKRDKTLSGHLKNVSITLYEDIVQQPHDPVLAERILLLFSDERGAYKRTYQKRFEAFDSQALDVLKKIFKSTETLSFHDVSVSDGRTALDFFEKAAAEFPQIQYFASDYNPLLYIVEKGRTKVTLSHTGKVLEILFPPFVFNKIKKDCRSTYPLNHLICFLVEAFIVNPLVKQYQQGLIKAKPLLLFAPQVLQKAQKDTRFKVGQYNLLDPFEHSVRVIRAMNVLNPLYFSESEFLDVVKNIYKGLEPGGLFITGSNQEAGSLVHGGIYQKTPQGFHKILQSGHGSPIEPLIVAFNP